MTETTIYDELNALFSDNQRLREIIATAKTNPPEGLTDALYAEGIRVRDQSIKQDTRFWAFFKSERIWAIMFFGSDKNKDLAAAWLRMERELCRMNGKPYPPED